MLRKDTLKLMRWDRWGGVTIQKIMPLRGLSCKLRLSRSSARLRFQDRPGVAKLPKIVANGCFDETLCTAPLGPKYKEKEDNHNDMSLFGVCDLQFIIKLLGPLLSNYFPPLKT